VKRYRLQGPEVHLLPENPAFNPIVVDLHSQELLIEGVVVGVMRDAQVQ
jgi:repressor LexA